MFRKKILSMVLLMGMLISQSIPTALAATYCDQTQFMSDLTAPDGSAFAPGSAFTKTWRLMNIGTCTWSTSYNLVWAGGDSIGAPASVRLPAEVPPGQMVDVSVNLTAPNTAGHYKALFKISNASGVQFGIGDSASDPFWADINVIQTNAVIYDFIANAPFAQWRSGAGLLPFPGTSGDSRGFAYSINNPHLEDDSIDSSPGLLTVPQNKLNGYIQAAYPEFQVQQGDRLQTLVNCEFGATSCYVTFRIDYLLPNGVQKTLWSWKEAYDKRFYRADLDLSSLAGQKVRFVFMLLSSGFASGDRAIWGSPRIVRSGATQPPAPPATLTPLPPLPPTATPIGQPPPTIAPSGCNRAAFVTDVTIPDGTIFSPGAAFTKTWRLKNIGSCAWTTSYKLVYYSGDQMGTNTAVNLPWNVAFDQTVDISVNLVAPTSAAKYRGYWILTDASGGYFGIGANASNPIWVEINVADESSLETGYSFWQNVCSAQWKSGAGALPCPGTEGDTKGFVISSNFSHLEDGTMGPAPSLLLAPENKFNGYIQGTFPTFTVQSGDHFISVVGCEYGYSCYVTFRLDYMTANGGIFNFWSWREQNDNQNHMTNVDLSPLAGRSVRFILTILATGSPAGDRVRWGAPAIIHAGAPPIVTPVPPTDTWPVYINQTYGFQFKYPPQSQRFFETTSSILIQMPITPGTNLREKYLQMSVRENVNPCESPLSSTSRPGSPRETVVINGISFLKQIGGDAGVGHLHEWVGYSTLKDNACISMDFVLHSLNADNSEPPLPEFDKAAESAVFPLVMSTFSWLAAPITPTPTTIPPGVIPSPNISKLFMINETTGWAITDSYVLRTTDGGRTWYNMIMPSLPSIRNAFFRNSNVGWVLTTDSIYRTTNGGSTWTHYSVPFNGGYIQFLDDTNGFVLSGEGIGMQKHPVSLYQTSNGGATWTLKFAHVPTLPDNGLPVTGHKDGMTFRDTSTGWVGGDVPDSGVYIFKTTNSGVTWAQQPLTLPAGYETAFTGTTAPIFFGANDAILPVWMDLGSGPRSLFTYVTHNGGATWSLAPGSVPSASPSLDFVSINDGFVWDGVGAFQVTNNAGASWRQVTSNVNFDERINALDFVSTTTGWAYDIDLNGNSALYRTTDGGHTWAVLFGNPSIPPTSTPTATPTATAMPSPTGTMSQTQTPTATPTSTASSVTFIQSVVDTLNARNFDTAKAMMDQKFIFAYWESQGVDSTPDQAIESLRTQHLGATPLTSDDTKDLAALFGGLNPYAIMGLDPAKSQALYVSGWGLDGNAEAILYATSRADGTLYWYGVLVAPNKFVHETPTATATPTSSAPVTLTGPYAVIGVASGDVLNIRAGAGVNYPIIGSFAPGTVNVMRTGSTASASNATWVQVQNPGGGTGWVNSSYLTEYVTHEAFCADPKIASLIEQLKQAIVLSNGALFGSLVSPKHGMNINYWPSSDTVNYTPTTAQMAFTNPQVINWGSGGGSGTVDIGTFAQIVQPQMVDVLSSAYQLNCDALSYGKTYTNVLAYTNTNIHFYSVVKPPTTGMDWKVWLIRIEYVNGQPYVFGAVHYIWEP